MFCGQTLWTLSVDTLWTLFCGHFLWTTFVDTFSGFFPGHFLWTLFLDTFCEHFLGTINCSAEIMVNKSTVKNWIYFLPRHTSYELPGSTDNFCLMKMWVSTFFLNAVFNVSMCCTSTYTTNKHNIVIPWALRAVTVGNVPPFLTAHYTRVGWMFTMESFPEYLETFLDFWKIFQSKLYFSRLSKILTCIWKQFFLIFLRLFQTKCEFLRQYRILAIVWKLIFMN